MFERIRKKAFNIFYPDRGVQSLGIALLPNTRFNYARDVGDALNSSVVMSPIAWLQRTFPEAPFEVVRLGTNEDETVVGHPLARLIRKPNSFYSGNALWSATIFSWIRGNAYWVKLRTPFRDTPWYNNIVGEVQQLWYVPHWMIQPKWPPDGSEFISHYEYTPDGKAPVEVNVKNVVHFRNGIDPRNPRFGLDMLESEYREIFTDAEAANYTAALLKNMGIPGVVISPEPAPQGGTVVEFSTESADAMKAKYKASVSGDFRGEPIVMNGPVKVQPFGFDPKKMDVSSIRNGNETRLCAKLGIPTAVVGFQSGNETTKVGAAMQAYKRLAWEGGIKPMQDNFGETVGNSLLPDFEADPDNFECWFNYLKVSAMQENAIENARRIAIISGAGLITVKGAQKELGIDVDESQNVYLRSVNTVEVPEGETRDLGDAPVQTDAPDIPKARFKSSGDRRFLRVQSRLESAAKSDIAALFAEESSLVQKAYRQSVKAQTKDWLDRISKETRQRWEALLDAVIAKSIEAGWDLLGDEIEGVLGFDVFQPESVTFAKLQAGNKVKEISDTTLSGVRDVIADAVESGWGIDKTAKALRELYEDFAGVRAETIARTETANAVNYGKHQAAVKTAEETGMKLRRVWSSVHDGRTREAHSKADGQTQKLGEPFLVGSEKLMHPGDPNGSAENTIRCRCTQFFQEIENES